MRRSHGRGPLEAGRFTRGLSPRASGGNALFAGVALAALACGASGAKADCTASGETALIVNSNLVPFASGGAVNSLVSAINTANTAFLTQSSAFIGSPANPNPDQLGGGAWARGIGGQFTYNSTATSTYNLDTRSLGLGILPVSGNITCKTTTRLDFAGVQVGTDIARLDWNGWNLHIGQTLGFMGAKARDVSSAGPNDSPGGTFQNTLEIPFIGFYGAATYGGLFIDGQVRWNYYQNRLNDPVQNGLFGQRLDARGVSLTGNIGYNYRLDGNWFLEPSAGVVWSRTSIDPLNVSGTLVLADSPGLAPPGTVSIRDIYSTLGRLSLRGGTSVDAGGVTLQPFATMSLFHDFEGGQSATIQTNFSSLVGQGFPEINGQLAISRLGTYGQFGLGTVAQLKDTGWLAYFRGDYRTGASINGWSLNGGVRYQFSPATAVVTGRSADVAAVPVAIAYDWTGFYLGGFLGTDWGYTNWTFPGGGTTNPRFAGLLGGGGLGYNYQIGTLVLGVEGDFGWTNAKGARSCPNLFGFGCEVDVNWLSTITGRIGLAHFDRLLWYFKGGLALGQVKATGRCNTGAETLFTGAPSNPDCPARSMSRTAVGWTIGAGGEFALTDTWSVKAETNYFVLGTARYSFGSLAPNGADISRSGFISRVGVTYRFTDFFAARTLVAEY